MKGSIASLLAAIEAFQATQTPLEMNIECSFTADEEIGGALGAGWVVKQGLVNAANLLMYSNNPSEQTPQSTS